MALIVCRQQVGYACLPDPEPWSLHAGVQEMLAVAERMDLSQNVFQDGTWGTLRYTPRLI